MPFLTCWNGSGCFVCVRLAVMIIASYRELCKALLSMIQHCFAGFLRATDMVRTSNHQPHLMHLHLEQVVVAMYMYTVFSSLHYALLSALLS